MTLPMYIHVPVYSNSQRNNLGWYCDIANVYTFVHVPVYINSQRTNSNSPMK
jgi:hypothetical protein